MKAHAVISVLLVLVCTGAARAQVTRDARGFDAAPIPVAGPAAADVSAENARSIVASVSADLAKYWGAEVGARVPSYVGPSAIVYYTSRIDTACGVTYMQNARYCPQDRTIYLDETWIDRFLANDDFGAIAILAHEWGHEVQDEFGAMDASSERRYVRALELQADCYAGLFIRSMEDEGTVGERAGNDARRFFTSAGDPSPKTRSHGTGPERVAWFNAGYFANDLATCQSVFQKEHAVPRIPSE
jgi:predicted metalloprotease